MSPKTGPIVSCIASYKPLLKTDSNLGDFPYLESLGNKITIVSQLKAGCNMGVAVGFGEDHKSVSVKLNLNSMNN